MTLKLAGESLANDEHAAELLTRLLANDEQAWKQFQDLYARLLYQCITRVTSRFPATSIDDVQEILAGLYFELFKHDKKKLRAYDQQRGTKFTSWLGLLATHAAYDFLRARRRARLADEPELLELMPSAELDPYELCLAREQRQLLSSFVHHLSERDQQFVELYFCRGMSPEQVASSLGISVKTVYSKKHKIRGRLAGILEKRQMAA